MSSKKRQSSAIAIKRFQHKRVILASGAPLRVRNKSSRSSSVAEVQVTNIKDAAASRLSPLIRGPIRSPPPAAMTSSACILPNWSEYHQEVRMNSPVRHSVTLGAVTLAIGLAAGATFLASADDGLHSVRDICTTTGSEAADEAPFLAENDAAMKKMMNDMAVKPTGDVDVDFVAVMVPHHQGAIDMALAVLRYGRNAQIRRLAQEIVVTQQQEIAAMRLAVGEPLPPSAPSPTQPSTNDRCRLDDDVPGMKMK